MSKIWLQHYVDYLYILKTYWKQLQSESYFCDVTLACDDRQYKTHKFIFSLSHGELVTVMCAGSLYNNCLKWHI